MAAKGMQVRSKVGIEVGGAVVAGEGKVHLLKRIDKLGSMRKPAEKPGMTYRQT